MSDLALLLLVALAVDAMLGEPRALWDRLPHPAVVMGRAIGWCDGRFNAGSRRWLRGVLILAGLAGLGWTLGAALSRLPFGAIVETALAAILLAQRSLVDHVRAVAEALRISLPEGRRAVAMIVGRDTATLDAPAVARAAIESGAENLSDGVVAPAFWFLVAGLPGMIVYKIVNTADSMIGHRTERHEAFGWAAARLDDALNWIPARLTAALVALSHLDASALRTAFRDGPRHRSVNAGYPEAAMARVLGLALSGPRAYGGAMTADPVLNPEGRRRATPEDIDACAAALWRVWATGFLTVALIAAL